MNQSKLRLAFAGTPELARIVLESLIKADEHHIQMVFTQPDRPAGRGRKLQQSEVKQCALEHGLSVLQPERAEELKPEHLQNVDIMLIVAYGLLITPEVLAGPKYGCINIHTSLLPRWRGAAPIQRAIEAGDKESGITIMQMDAGLDTGPIIKQLPCPILDDDTGGTLHDRLAKISADAINPILKEIADDKISKLQQDDTHSTYAHKISKQEASIDWTKPAIEIERKIRAFNPFPVTHSVLNGVTMRIWEAKVIEEPNRLPAGTLLENKSRLEIVTGNGILSILRLQLPGKKIVTAQDFLNGHPNFFN